MAKKTKKTDDIDALIVELKTKKIAPVKPLLTEVDLLDESDPSQFGFKDLLEDSEYSVDAFEIIESPQSWWNRFTVNRRVNGFCKIPTAAVPIHECGGVLLQDVTVHLDSKDKKTVIIFPWSLMNVESIINLAARQMYANQQKEPFITKPARSNFYYPAHTKFDEFQTSDYYSKTSIIPHQNLYEDTVYPYMVIALSGYSINEFEHKVAIYEVLYFSEDEYVPPALTDVRRDRDMNLF